MGRCMPILSGSAKVQGYTRGGECWRWYARGVARHCRPQGANGIERHCRAHAATLLGRRGPVRAAQGLRAGAKATTARPRGGCAGNLDQATISLGLQVLATKPAGTMNNLRAARFPGSYHRVGRKRQALSTPSPGEPSLKPAHRYLSLRFQTIQSCSPARYPITTAVQPWREQECAYTFVISPNLLRVALPVCDARCTFVQLRFSTSTASARYGFVRFLLFFIDFAFLQGR
jgi:hypothetical protein